MFEQVQQYRFSISWTRIYPSGKDDSLNKAGIDHYHTFIDDLIQNGIEPIPTLYYKDLPQALQDEGGWINRSIIDYFCDYAKECFKQYGNKVKFDLFPGPWVCTIITM